MDDKDQQPIQITLQDLAQSKPSQPIGDQIQVGEPFSTPKKPGIIDKLYSKFITPGKINLLPVQEKETPPDLLEQVRLLPPSVEDLIKVIKETNPNEVEAERLAAVYVSAETNQASAAAYVRNLRTKTPDIINAQLSSYTSGEWYYFPDLNELSNRWHLPLMTIRKDANHWVLALKEPERTDDGWRVLIYDPRENLESWQNLDEWDPELENPANLTSAGIFMNELAYKTLMEKEYDYSLIGDEELADHSELYRAKQVRTQYNSEDCGPLTLYAAALRQGIKPGWNEFKFAGREVLQKDTGISIHTREELIQGEVRQM